jgi:8-oxo-dGTP diphosphatase
MNKIIVVAGIIFRADGHFLIARKKTETSYPGLWEFPGGKIEVNETPEAALKRELLEELNILISEPIYFHFNEYRQENSIIALNSYKANYISGEIRLTDHDLVQWINIDETNKFNFTPADIPVVMKLKSFLLKT